MRQNDDGKTVAAFDILLPGVGEVVGGSAREERLDLLESAMQHHNIQGLDWYSDLRRHGSVPHAGFGIGMERLGDGMHGHKKCARRSSFSEGSWVVHIVDSVVQMNLKYICLI